MGEAADLAHVTGKIECYSFDEHAGVRPVVDDLVPLLVLKPNRRCEKVQRIDVRQQRSESCALASSGCFADPRKIRW